MFYYRLNTLIWILVNLLFLYPRNLVESIDSINPSGSQTSIVTSQDGTKQLKSLEPPRDDKAVFSENVSQNTSNPGQESQPVDPQVDEDSEDHELEFTEGARCVEVRCHGELVWKPENENQGKSIRLRRTGDDLEIVDNVTGEVKRIELGNALYLDIFTFGSLHPNDKSKYVFTSPSDEEGHYIFKKGVRCTEIRGNGLLIWKYRTGDQFPRAVSYFGTRHVSISFTEGSSVYNRIRGMWVNVGEDIDAHTESQPQVPEQQSSESPSISLSHQAPPSVQSKVAADTSLTAPCTVLTVPSKPKVDDKSISKVPVLKSTIDSGVQDGSEQTSSGSVLDFTSSTPPEGQVPERPVVASGLTELTADVADSDGSVASPPANEPDSDSTTEVGSLRRASITHVSDSHVEGVFSSSDSGHTSGAPKGSTAGRSSETVKPKSRFPSLCRRRAKRSKCFLRKLFRCSSCCGKDKCTEGSSSDDSSCSDCSCLCCCCSSGSDQTPSDAYKSVPTSCDKSITLNPIDLNVFKSNSTETFDCLQKDGFVKYTPKPGFGFSSVNVKSGITCCGLSLPIWDANLPADYASVVVRDDNGSSSSIINVTIFCSNNFRHFNRLDDNYVEDAGVRLYGKNSSNKSSELAATEFTVELKDDVFSFTFNDDTNCTEVVFMDRRLEGDNSAKVISEKVSLWEHDPNHRGGIYPKSFDHYTKSNVLVLRFDGLDMTFENTHEGWVFTETGPLAVVFHLEDPNDNIKTVELPRDQLSVSASGSTTTFSIPDGVKCTKFLYGSCLMWQQDPLQSGPKYPKSLDYDKSKESFVLKFDGLDLTYTKSSQGEWEYTESFSHRSRHSSTPPLAGSSSHPEQPYLDQSSLVTSVVSYSETPKPAYELSPSELNDKSKDDLVKLVLKLSNDIKDLKMVNKKMSSEVIRITSPSPKKIYPVVLQTTDLMCTEFYVYTKEDNKHIYTAKTGHLFKLVKHFKDILWHTITRDEFANKVELVDDKKAVIYHTNGSKTEKELTLYLVTLNMDIKNSRSEIIYKKNDKKQIEKYICKPSFLIEAAWANGLSLWPPRSTPSDPYTDPKYTRKIVVNHSNDPPSFRAFFPDGSDEGDDDDENDPDYVVVPDPDLVNRKTFKTQESPTSSGVTEPTPATPSQIDIEGSILTSSYAPPPETSECIPEIKLFTSDPNDASKTVELDPSKYEVNKLNEVRTDYDFKDGVKCTLVLCEGNEVWRHGHLLCEQYPRSVSYMNGTTVVITLPSFSITYEKSTITLWTGTIGDEDTPQRFNSDESIR